MDLFNILRNELERNNTPQNDSSPNLFNFIRNELIEVIEWVDSTTDTVIWKFQDAGNNLKHGAQLTVRESQVAVLLNEGQLADVYLPGRHTLTTQNMPLLTTLRGWQHGFQSPFKVDVYFVSTKQFTNLKWGTQNPFIVRDPEFKQVRVRAFGTYALRVQDAGRFVREFAGTTPIVRVADVEEQLRSAIVAKFTDAVAETGVSVLDLARNYRELGEQLRPLLQEDFGTYGLELTRFYLENTSLPPEVEAFLDKTTQMNMAGDMARFQQFQAGLALEKAAEHGGAAGTAVLLGGLGNFMGHAAAPAAAPAPPPVAAPAPADPPFAPPASSAAASAASPQAAAPTAGADQAKTLELLKQLGELKAAGVLTEEEFSAKKAELLARL